MIVAAGIGRHFGERFTAIERARKRSGKEKDFVLVVGRNLGARVVVGAAAELAVGVNHLPALAAVVGAPEFAELSGTIGLGDAVAGFHFGVDAVGIFFGDADGNSAYGRMRQAVTFEALPGEATVGRLE